MKQEESTTAGRERKNAGFLMIVRMLRTLRDDGVITGEEYAKAKNYYLKATGADIILA